MAKEENIGLTVKKSEDFSEWYNQAVLKSELADYSPVKGCMVIRPLGYAVWENIQKYFNAVLEKHRVKNAYFPLFVPETFFKKEAEHAKGFRAEVAWISNTEEGERLAIRPTSETIMYDMYAKWIRSHRDLPFRLNQWCNIVRWETKATKLFLRTREFLWQEGHCVYATEEECDKETVMILDEYKKMIEGLLAIPVLVGKKTDAEKFAGALYTTTVEAMMPDGKALQMGTSHNLGQFFAKTFGISFLGKDEKKHIPWQSSWGFSTRLIGAIVMVHGDDKGIIIPPRAAPTQVVIVPILFEKDKKRTVDEAREIKKLLQDGFRVELDDREEYSAGWKFNEYELKGVPLRIEIGPKDIQKKEVVLVRRDNFKKESVKISELKKRVAEALEAIQKGLFKEAKKLMDDSIVEVKKWEEFKKAIEDEKMVKCLFCNTAECEKEIKDKTGATSRCIISEKAKGECAHCGKKANVEIYFSKSY